MHAMKSSARAPHLHAGTVRLKPRQALVGPDYRVLKVPGARSVARWLALVLEQKGAALVDRTPDQARAEGRKLREARERFVQCLLGQLGIDPHEGNDKIK